MTARIDKRTGRWYFRVKVTCADGTSPRLFGIPTDYGQPDSARGAEEAERIATIKAWTAAGTVVPGGPQNLEDENSHLRAILGAALVNSILQKVREP